MKDITCQVLVVGAGPGGYVAAIRAGQLGLDTVIVEAGKPGGTVIEQIARDPRRLPCPTRARAPSSRRYSGTKAFSTTKLFEPVPSSPIVCQSSRIVASDRLTRKKWGPSRASPLPEPSFTI